MQPYPYQSECLLRLAAARQTGKQKALVVMASGLGKTVTVALDIRQWLTEHPNEKVLYLCHQNDILDQAKNTSSMVIGGGRNRYGLYHGGRVKTRRAQFLFASFQTMRLRLNRFQPNEFGYIVVDESHHTPAATYQPIIAYFAPQFLLGVTATPDRVDMKDIRQCFGGDEIFSLPLADALAQGLLAKVDYRLIIDEVAKRGEININPQRTSIQELNKKIFLPKRDAHIAGIIAEKTSGLESPKIIVFCPSIRHAEMLQHHISRAATVHSAMPLWKQRMRIRDFRLGRFDVILTVDKFNEGIDIPEINVVVFLRLTQSETVFYQQLGRGLRKKNGKDGVLVLDFVANCERILLVDKLNRSVAAAQHRYHQENPDKFLIIDSGEFHFTETVQNVLNILEKLRGGYTKSVLIDQLKKMGERLRRVPRVPDALKEAQHGRSATVSTFGKFFGSWSKALIAAGFSPNRVRIRWSRTEMLEQLQKLSAELGRAPRRADINRNGRGQNAAGQRQLIREFGSVAAVLQELGISAPRTAPYQKEELIMQLQNETARIGRTPSQKEINRASQARRTGSLCAMVRVFGSYRKALRAAGLPARRQGQTIASFSQR